MEQQPRINPDVEDGFERGRSVQTWQCFGGSLSSIDSLPPIEDDESGTEPGFLGSPATARLDYDSGQNLSREEPTSFRVKLMCSFGGRIMPRPSDGKLRYVGGETRIVSVKRDVTYVELMLKMKKHYGEDLSLKYQLPNEDLDALISVSTDEDLQNMMEEYDRLEDEDGLHRLRVFLFSLADSESVSVECLDPKKSEQWYVEAINGLLETGSRKSESGVSGGGGLSTRPSVENLIALDASFEEQLPSRKLYGVFSSTSSSPTLTSQQPHNRLHGSHPYMMFESEGHQHLGNINTEAGHFDMDHYYHQHDRPQDYDRIPHHLQEKRMPRVGSHGKLSRLKEQHFDDVQQPPDLLSQDLHFEPRTRFQHAQSHCQHFLDNNQVFHADTYSHFLQHEQSQPSAHLKDTPMYKGESCHHHQFPDDYILRHHHDDYYLAQMYQQHGDVNVGSHLTSHQKGSSPSSPQLRCCDTRGHPQPTLHKWNPAERQYGTRLYPRNEIPQNYGFSPSPPRFRNHHFEEQMPFLPQEQFTSSPGSFILDQKLSRPRGYDYLEEGYGYQEDIPFYQENIKENIKTGGNQIQNLSPLSLENEMVKLEHLSLDRSQDHLEPKTYQLLNKNTLSVIPTDESLIQTQQKSKSYGLPIFDTISQWNEEWNEENFERQLLPSIGTSVNQVPYKSRGEIEDENDNIFIQTGNNISHGMSETSILAENMASSILKSFPISSSRIIKDGNSSMLNEEVTMVDKPNVVSQPIFIHSTPVIQSNWDNDLLKVEAEDNIKNDSYQHEISHDMEDKVENNFLPIDISVIAEQEAKALGLQIIKNLDLEEIRELGSGTYGTVYHGKWRGTDVAIKRIKASCFEGNPSERERLILDFWREAGTLSKLHHPNVVAFYGVVPDGPGGTLATVTEYMVNGSLKQVIQKKDRTIDRRKRLLIATDAAFGMEYLHGKNIVHFDLKCENLLVNMRDPHRPVCKVGDLGLSKVKRQTMVSGGVRGTLPWMAPELLSTINSKVTERVDVFSFGIVMWELLTGEEPYANMHYGAIIGGIVSNTLRPPVPSWCEPAWRSLMERCWDADPSIRPSFAEIANELRSMSSSLQPKT